MRRVLDVLTLYAIARVAGSIVLLPGVSATVSEADSMDGKKKFEIAAVVAEQIWREQQLTSNRMTWNLTFQGFLFTAFSFTFVNLTAVPSVPRLLLQIVIALGGFSVGRATKHSILASQYQRDFMKNIWDQLYKSPTLASYPRPFSVNPESERGRRSATSIIYTILCMWGALGALALIAAVVTNWQQILNCIRRVVD